jgi:hypothetical protein
VEATLLLKYSLIAHSIYHNTLLVSSVPSAFEEYTMAQDNSFPDGKRCKEDVGARVRESGRKSRPSSIRSPSRPRSAPIGIERSPVHPTLSLTPYTITPSHPNPSPSPNFHQQLPTLSTGNPIISRREARAYRQGPPKTVRFADEKTVVSVNNWMSVERVVDNEWKRLNKGLMGRMEKGERRRGL